MNIFEFLAPIEVQNIIFETKYIVVARKKNLWIYGMYFNS
jgi:hypothetical protein